MISYEENYEKFYLYSYTLHQYYKTKPLDFVKDYDENECLIFETMLALANYWKDIFE